MEMVTIPTPSPAIRPAPAKTATAKPHKVAPAPRPLPAPIKPSPQAITTGTRAEVVTSKTPVAIEEPAASHSEPAPPSPPTHIGGHLGNPQPVYPPLSIELGEAGAVGLRVAVGADGRAQEVSVARSSGFPRLDRAALQAVRNWRFRPATRGGEATPYTYVFNIDFDLTKA